MNTFSFHTIFIIAFLTLNVCYANVHSIDNHHMNNEETQTDYNDISRYMSTINNIKRERPLQMSGFGWDECEFSPLSCLLKKRSYIR
uniref:Hypotheticial protein n=1 Tax=Strongyloides stercoralis TaxID=6248 RepID=A0A0K0EKI3_STRER